MIENQECLDRLKFNEGLSTTPVRCPAGFLSIGYGRNIETNKLTQEEKQYIGHPIDATHPITEKQAEHLLQNDVKKVSAELDKRFPWWRNMDGERQYVMLDLAFNMGVGTLSKFKNTLKAMEEGDYDKAAENLKNSKYFRQTGNRAARNYVCLKTGVYVPEVTQKTMDNTVLKLKGSAPKTVEQGAKEVIQEDHEKYKQIQNKQNNQDQQKKVVARFDGPNSQNNQYQQTKKVGAKLEAPDSKKKQTGTVYELRNTDDKKKQTGTVYELRNTDSKKKQTGTGGLSGSEKTKDQMKASAEKSKAKLKSMITAMNKKNKKSKAVDGDKAAEILYGKYGKNAQKKLQEAMMSPVKYGKENGDTSIKTSREAVNHLIKTAKTKGRS